MAVSTRYEVENLCAQIRRIESIPTSENTFTDYDITELMNMELQSAVVPLIQRVREEYFVISKIYTVGNGVKTIEIPSEAIGMRLRDVSIIDSNGILEYLPRLNPEYLTYGRRVYGYTLQNNELILHTNKNNEYTIKVSYFKRPNDLTTGSHVMVTGKNGNNEISVTKIHDSFTITSELDLISKFSPFVGKAYMWLPTAITTNTITVPSDVYEQTSIGDYITLSGTAPVPQSIPVEAHHLLVQGTAMRCLEALGDRDGWKIASAKYTKMENDLLAIINPRVESQSKKIVKRRSILE